MTLQINAYQLDFAAVCRILYLYGCGGIFTSVGINVQIYIELYAQAFKVEQDFAQVDFYARLVEDVSEYARKADIGFGTFRKFKFEGRAEVEHLVDNTFNEHMTRIRSALRDFRRFRTNFLRPVGSAADSHVGYAYRAFRYGAFIIHIVVELSYKVQLHPVGIIFVAADGKVDCRVVIAQVGVHAEQVEERFNRGEGHHGDDVVLRYADEHRLVFGKTRPVAVTVCLGKVCRGNVALAAFIGRRLPVAAVNDAFGIIERLSEHFIHKTGYVEVGSMVLGHRYAEQVEVGQVDVQVVAVDYQIQEVCAFPEQHLILYRAVFILRRAHYHILVKGELDRAQRIFGRLRVKGQAERKRKSELHTARVGAVVLIKRLEYEVESVCVGKSAVYKTEVVEQVAYTEHTAGQRQINVQIERDVAEQIHNAVGKRRAVGKVYFGRRLFLDCGNFVAYIRAAAYIEHGAESIDVFGFVGYGIVGKRARARSYLHAEVELAVHKQQIALRFHEVYCVAEQRAGEVFKQRSVRVKRHAQVFEAYHLNEIAYQRAHGHLVHGERRSGAHFLNVRIDGRVFQREQFVQVEIDIRKQIVNLRFEQLHNGGIGDFQHTAAQCALSDSAEVDVNFAFAEVNADCGFPITIAYRVAGSHFYADIGVDCRQIVPLSVKYEVEPVLHIGGSIEIERKFGINLILIIHTEQTEQTVERVFEVEGIAVAVRAEFQSQTAGKHAVDNFAYKVARLIRIAFRHVAFAAVSFDVREQFVAHVFVRRTKFFECRGQGESRFKVHAGRSFGSVVQLQLQLALAISCGGENYLPRQFELGEVDYRSIIQYLGDGGKRHAQRKVAAEFERSVLLLSVCKRHYRRKLLSPGRVVQSRQHIFYTRPDNSGNFLYVLHNFESAYFEYGQFDVEQIQL